MSIASDYELYRDRVYRMLNEFFPLQRSLDILTGNDEERPTWDEWAGIPDTSVIGDEDDEFSDG